MCIRNEEQQQWREYGREQLIVLIQGMKSRLRQKSEYIQMMGYENIYQFKEQQLLLEQKGDVECCRQQQRSEYIIQNRRLKFELNELFKIKEEEQQQYNKVIQELRDKIGQIEEEKVSTEQKYKQLSQRQNKLIQQRDKLIVQLHNTTQQNRICQQQNNNYISQIHQQWTLKQNTYKSQLNHKTISLQSYISKYQSLIISNTHTLQSLISKQTQLSLLNIQYNQSSSNLLQYQSEIHSLNHQISTLQTSLSNSYQLHQSLQSQNQQLLAKIHSISIQKQTLIQSSLHSQQLISSNQSKISKLTLQIQQNKLLHQNNIQKNTQQYQNKINTQIQQLKTELSELKFDTIQQIKNLQTQFIHQILQLNIQIERNNVQKCNTFIGNQSTVFNRQQMLQFQIQQIKKQIILLKSQNCALKYQKKKYFDKIKNKQNQKSIIQQLKLQIIKLNAQLRTHQPKNTPILTQFHTNKKSSKKKYIQSNHDQNIFQQLYQMRKKIKNAKQQSDLRLHHQS